MLTVTETGRGFELQFDYMPHIVREIKSIGGARWNPVLKLWILTKDKRREVERLNEKYGAPVIAQRPEEFDEVPALPEPSDEIVEWAKQNLKLMPYHYQLQGIEKGVHWKRFINGDEPGLGKEQNVKALISTPNGWVRMGDIGLGEDIFTQDGSIQHVTGIFPQGVKPSYRITFNDNSSTECGLEHLWSVRDANRRKRKTGFIVKSLKELLQAGIHYKQNVKRESSGRNPALKWEIPMCEPVQFPTKAFFIDAYTLGALIGDGSLTGTGISLSLPESKYGIINAISVFLIEGYHVKKATNDADLRFFITCGSRRNNNEYVKKIIDLGLNVLSEKKFIPREYMMGSVFQRKCLLAGLMDTDGSCIKNRTVYHTMSKQLASDVKELTESLGGVAIIHEYDRTKEGKGIEYQVNIRTSFNPFKFVAYKADAWKPNNRFLITRYIKSVEYVGDVMQQCISVSGESKLYLTDNYIVTHNTMQTIATITKLNAFPALIVCPSTLKENWRREWSEKFTNKRAMVLTDKVKSTWHTYLKVGMVDVMIVNYESLKKYFVESIDVPEGKRMQLKHVKFKEQISLFQSIAFDEIHKCKEITTMQAKLSRGLSKGKEVIIGLTGTPIVNGPKDLASQVGIIEQFPIFGNYKNFIDRYCEGGKGAANLKELNYKMHSNFYFRRNKKDVLKDLPDRTRQVMICDISTRREYDKAKNEFVYYLKEMKGCTDQEIRKKMKAQFIVQLGILKGISAKGKLASVFEWVDEIIESGEKVILFCSLREIGNQVMEKYGKACVAVRGDVTGDARQSAIDRFQKCGQCGILHQDHDGQEHEFVNNDVKVIVCSIKAAGTGLTLTASSRVGFIEFPWHDADCDQCESRSHRNGQKNAVLSNYFLGDNTVDSYCYDIIKNKRSISKQVSGQDDIDEEVIDNMISLFN